MARKTRRRKRSLGSASRGACKLPTIRGNSASAKKRRGKALARYNKCRASHGIKPRRRRRGKR